MTDYDRWLEAPYANQPEQEECPECDGEGRVLSDDVQARILTMASSGSSAEAIAEFVANEENAAEPCERCDGTGWIDPPTREEIKERKEEIDADRRLSE